MEHMFDSLGTERIPPFSLAPGELAAFTRLLSDRGVAFRKVDKSGRGATKLVRMENTSRGLTVSYAPSKSDNSLLVANIWRIDTGKDALQYIDGSKYPEDRLQHLIAITACRLKISAVDVRAVALDARFVLEAPDLLTRTRFEQALAFEVARRRNVSSITAMQTRIAEVWLDADKDGSGSIDRYELEQALTANGIPLERGSIEALVKQFDTDRSGFIEFSEFDLLMREIMDPSERTIEMLFSSFASPQPNGGPSGMTAQDFMQFLFNAQGESINAESAKARVRTLSRGKNTPVLCVEDFVFMYLANATMNSWMRPEHEQVFMDMSQPLHHYFIATSHNTALEGDQLVSKCTSGWVREVLRAGARCIELEIRDFDYHDDGVIPVVHRRYSRCEMCPLETALTVIRKHAFDSSPFPLILFVELHDPCDVRRVARLLRDSLGELVFTPEDKDGLASSGKTFCPEALRKRIVIAACIDDEIARSAYKRVEAVDPVLDRSHEQDLEVASGHDCLRSLVTLQLGKHVEGASGERWGPSTVGSATCGEGLRRLVKKRWQVVDRTTGGFLRIYPIMTDSRNMDPTSAFELGAQLIATNWQTCDAYQRRIEAMFAVNGGSGYLLKPLYMRKSEIMPDATACLLTITVVQGFQIPRPPDLSAEERLRPCITASIIGTGDAQKHEATWNAVDDPKRPPFSPVFSATGALEDTEPLSRGFRLKGLDVGVVSLLLSHVCDDATQMPIASATIPLTSLRFGYRAVPLRSVLDNQELPHAVLLCHFRMDT
eukprot:CAMPEP_0174835446 /NCGR_PEP_ID=MMETSP1114-20130205/5408_1 /TAXON_ID=312471 /ORGANISM="Neobodo designis, Strain CCAP 1951/1" /LENGTH=774 /DNA_ID=CAMNT_0016069393 /DNA_START=29 /DNA_END=2353 /DNA_ORIENTATION=+